MTHGRIDKERDWKPDRGSWTNGETEKMSFRPVRWEIWEEAWDKWRSTVAGVEGKTGKTEHSSDQNWYEKESGYLLLLQRDRVKSLFKTTLLQVVGKVTEFTVTLKAGKMFLYPPVYHLVSLSLTLSVSLSLRLSFCLYHFCLFDVKIDMSGVNTERDSTDPCFCTSLR